MTLLLQLRDYELRMRREDQQGGAGELPFMYALQNVRYEVRLRADGTFQDIQPHSSGKKGKDLGQPIPAPNVVRTSGIKPRLLMDNAEYALGLAEKEGDRDAATRHQAFKELLDAAAQATGEASLRLISRFLAQHDPASFREQYPDLTADMNVMFTVGGLNPLQLQSVQQFWASQFDAEPGDAGFRAECLITGEFGPVMKREPVKIKGIWGGKTSGMNFISANADAFTSYGLQASQIAPVKLEAAEQYASGLNRLLADPNTRMWLGGVTYVYWTGEGAVPLIGQLLEDEPPKLGFGHRRGRQPRPQEVREILWSLFTGQQPAIRRGTAFYMVGMTPSGSRIAVRTHLTSTVQEMVNHLADFFAAQQLDQVNSEGSRYPDPETYSVRTLVSGLYRDMSKEHPEPAVDALVGHALTGQPLPRSFLPKLNARNRAEQRVTRPRAVLTKMVLLSNDFKELAMDKETLDALDPQQKEPAYHLGRLLAVLDDIQSSVMKANTTLVDRFYGSMSTTPYAVVGRLIQGSQAHLQKLRKENEPAYRAKQRELEEVMGCLTTIPAQPLTTPQQAMFALGYYHQRAHISAQIRQRMAAKTAAKNTSSGAAPLLPLAAEKGDDTQ